MIETFQIEGDDAITCLVCYRTSHNPHDIRERYCGRCRQFHEFLGADLSNVEALTAFRDDTQEERKCHGCARPYHGPGVYCSMRCALDDAGGP